MKIGIRKALGIGAATLALAAAVLVASPGIANASGYRQIANRAYSQCAFVANTSLNIYLLLHACVTDGGLDLWAAVPAGPVQTYYLVNQASGYCLEVNNGTSTPGERVDAFYCNGSTAEQWIIGDDALNGRAYGLVEHAGTNQCLDTVGGAGSRLMQYTCAGNDAQRWKLF
jgi:hypothetical protein